MSPTPMTTNCPTGSSTTAAGTQLDHPLYARRQRHALRHAAGLQFRRPVLRLSEGQFRHALCRGQGGPAAHDEHRPALPPRRPAGPRRGAEALRRLCESRTTRSGWRGASTSPGTGRSTIRTGRRRCGRRRWSSRPSSTRSAASSSIRRGSPSAPMSWSSARRMTAPAACTMRSAASSAPPARPSGSACSTPIPTLPASWPQAKRLTAESTSEQASAGLDALTDKERELFSKLNAAYVTTFGFPFIIAVQGQDQGRDPRRVRDAHRQRPRHRIRHRLQTGRAHRAAPAEGHAAALGRTHGYDQWLTEPITRRMAAIPARTSC